MASRIACSSAPRTRYIVHSKLASRDIIPRLRRITATNRATMANEIVDVVDCVVVCAAGAILVERATVVDAIDVG